MHAVLLTVLVPGCGLLLDFGQSQGSNAGDGGAPSDARGDAILADVSMLDAGLGPARCTLQAIPTIASSADRGGVDLVATSRGLVGARVIPNVDPAESDPVIAELFVAGVIGAELGRVSPIADNDRVGVAALNDMQFLLGSFTASPGQVSLYEPFATPPLESTSFVHAFDVTTSHDPERPFLLALIDNASHDLAVAHVSATGIDADPLVWAGEYADVAIEIGPPPATVHAALVGITPESSEVELLRFDATGVASFAVTTIPTLIVPSGERTVRLVHAALDLYVLVSDDASGVQYLVRMQSDGMGGFAAAESVMISSSRAAIAYNRLASDLLAVVYEVSGGLRFELLNRLTLSPVNSVDVGRIPVTSIALERDPTGHALFVALVADDATPIAGYIEFACAD